MEVRKLQKSFWKKLGITLLLTVSVFGLVACGDKKDDQKTISVYNWGLYIDPNVLDMFEEETGIKVQYDEFSTNEDMYIKVKSGGSKYDIIIPSDYMIEKMIKEDMLAELNFDNIPNYANVDDQFKNLAYDPDGKYSVPYMWGTVGIVYNKTMVEEPITSWNALWDEKYKKQIFMLDSPRDSIGVALKLMGYGFNAENTEQLEIAKEKLIEQRPLVLSYVVDEVRDAMLAGEAAMALVWSGEGMYLTWNDENLEYVIPEEGSNIWFDSIVIPKDAPHKEEAEAFINFLCRPDIAKLNVEEIGYATPIPAAQELLAPEIKDDPMGYPSADIIAKCEVFRDPGEFLSEYDRVWTEVKASK